MQTDENHIPEIPGLNRDNPFAVPEGYFDRFPLKMADRIAAEQSRFRFPFPALLKPIPMLATALVLLRALVVGYRYLNTSVDPLSEEEISTYVYQEGILDDFSEEELLEYSELSIPESDTGADHQSSSDQHGIQEYLIESGIDEVDIINEL